MFDHGTPFDSSSAFDSSTQSDSSSPLDHGTRRTFPTPEPVTLQIRNASGTIRILLTDTQTTTVDVVARTGSALGFLDEMFKSFSGARPPAASVPQNASEAVRVEHRPGDPGVVDIDSDPARAGWRSSFDITVSAPAGSTVKVKSQSSAVTLTGRSAAVDVRTGSGEVSIDEVAGKALVQTASGAITLAAAADIDLRTASGAVRVGPVQRDAVVHTTSGDIEVGAVGGSIAARSVSGDVQVSDAIAGSAQISAVSGNVRIGVHSGSVASVDLRTVSGTTSTDLEVSELLPDGAVPVLEILVKTTSGDIELRRAASHRAA